MAGRDADGTACGHATRLFFGGGDEWTCAPSLPGLQLVASNILQFANTAWKCRNRRLATS